ncbi:tyrosine-type recombinase/integrase [Nonomuraea basaltis]|uniref:tyrosine-type recombinase/integrase n=1 Tax=Nonomuraea basaltis TaxID=2495887 RepID=UPI00110C5941|nr:tyrosine-type recombinase/integrase [Nonomuraea basaltis]TMR93827.1 phage integrase family protein [Nonomuraea basaltis]
MNLFHAPLREPMKYDNAHEPVRKYDCFAVWPPVSGFRAQPHMLRHSAITKMRQAGVDRRVAQEIGGHVSASSQNVYSHVTDSDKREAVEMVAAARRQAQS